MRDERLPSDSANSVEYLGDHRLESKDNVVLGVAGESVIQRPQQPNCADVRSVRVSIPGQFGVRANSIRKQIQVALSFLENIKILPLEVLYHCHRSHSNVIERDDPDGNIRQSGGLRSPPTSFAGDDLISVLRVWVRAHQYWLKDAVDTNRLCKIAK